MPHTVVKRQRGQDRFPCSRVHGIHLATLRNDIGMRYHNLKFSQHSIWYSQLVEIWADLTALGNPVVPELNGK